MAITKQEKEKVVSDLVDKINKAKSIIFVDFEKVKVSEIEQFRKLCRKEKIDYVVAKKTLLKIAMEKSGRKEIDPLTFEKGIGTLFGFEDEIEPAKLVDKFSKEHQNLKLVCGILPSNPENQKFLSLEQVKALAKIPSKQELLAKVVGSLNSPISGFVNVLSGTLRSLVYVLNSVKESKSK